MNTKIVDINLSIQYENENIAQNNFELFEKYRIFSINIMASPGAGKTSLIEKTINKFIHGMQIAVIDGDIASTIDADRASSAGALAVQINTGGSCHLDANMISKVLSDIDLSSIKFLIVENVGNLVCPANFKLGTHKNVLIASLPEGDDKPYKYPGIYHDIDLLILNKVDLQPYLDFRLDYFYKGVRLLNPGVKIIPISCKTEEGLQAWFDWINENIFW